MRFVFALAALLAIGSTLTCVKQGAFRCGDDADCMLDGVPGRCELIGFCSFPDATCETGQRFGEQSGDVAGQCVTGDIVPELVEIGGTVSGLVGSGLVLRNNDGDDLAVAADGEFAFPTRVLTGDPYDVSVSSQPTNPSQVCTVAGGAGVAGVLNVTDIAVTCATATFVVGGTVTGLTGSGLVLTNNGGDDKSIASNGSFMFATEVASGGGFAVAIKTQPSGQTCNVSGATGTVGAGNVSSVVVNCAANTFTVGGTISGLEGTVILRNGSDNQTVTSNGTWAMQTPLAPTTPYAVSVQTQPGYPPRSQTCVVTSGSGTMGNANVTSVVVTCTTNTFTIGGTISGLAGSITLHNGSDDLTLTANGGFTFQTPVASGGTYAVTIATQPGAQTCTLAMASGTATDADVTSVAVSCGMASGDMGVLCAGTYCDPAIGEICCIDNGTASCRTSCTGGGTTPIKCDDAFDCFEITGNNTLICCGSITGTTVNNIFCTKASLCDAPKVLYCDPTVANPCPNGGSCLATDIPFPGWFSCQ